MTDTLDIDHTMNRFNLRADEQKVIDILLKHYMRTQFSWSYERVYSTIDGSSMLHAN